MTLLLAFFLACTKDEVTDDSQPTGDDSQPTGDDSQPTGDDSQSTGDDSGGGGDDTNVDKDVDDDGYDNTVDCNDDNAAVNPGAVETCDGTDTNCSGDEKDATDTVVQYKDGDGDTYGDPNNSIKDCPTAGFVTNKLDCDDTNGDINPDGKEVNSNGIDEDCDGKDGGGGSTTTTSYATDIEPIFTKVCTTCHGSSKPSGSLDLSSGSGYANIVNVPSVGLSKMDLIEPKDTSNSYLWLKLNGTHTAAGGTGATMPKSGSVSSTQLATIETWINEGAPK